MDNRGKRDVMVVRHADRYGNGPDFTGVREDFQCSGSPRPESAMAGSEVSHTSEPAIASLGNETTKIRLRGWRIE